MNKEYSCICGKVFDNPQKFNGHKQGCKEHIINKYGSVEYYYSEVRDMKSIAQKLKEFNKDINSGKLERWISEQHKCEKCGKIMTKKYGSGRFCSRSCANSHKHSETTRNKISQSMNEFVDSLRDSYYLNPNYCQVCGSVLSFERKNLKTCTRECQLQLLSSMSTALMAERTEILTYGRNKYGTYKGFHCDSSWELAFVVYCLEHDITIERCKEKFPYLHNDCLHYYHPDFIICSDTYVEIKNYIDDVVMEKIIQFPYNLKYIILFWDSIKPAYEYVVQKYGKDFCSLLYDKNKPNFMN